MAQEQRELPLLTVLAWEERWGRWHAVPQESPSPSGAGAGACDDSAGGRGESP